MFNDNLNYILLLFLEYVMKGEISNKHITNAFYVDFKIYQNEWWLSKYLMNFTENLIVF